MTQSFTDALQQQRQIVVAVDAAAGRLRVRGDADACTDLACGEDAVLLTGEGSLPTLVGIHPGDIVRVEAEAGRVRRVVVVRRVWDELGSPEW